VALGTGLSRLTKMTLFTKTKTRRGRNPDEVEV
jgi:hypothetical protein